MSSSTNNTPNLTYYTTYGANRTNGGDQEEKKETVQELSKDVKNGRNLLDKNRGFRIPIVVALLTQLIVAVTVVAVPLSYISLNNASKITNDLTGTIISSTIQQTSEKLTAFFTQFANAVMIATSFPEIPYLEDCCLNDMSTGNVNLTAQIIRVLQQNPLASAIEVHFHNNISATTITAGPRLSILQDPCSFFQLPLNGTCYVRARADSGTKGSLLGRLLNPATGADLTPDVPLLPAEKMPKSQIFDSWDATGETSLWTILYVAGAFSRYNFVFGKSYSHVPTGTQNAWFYNILGTGFLPCEVTLVQYFNELLPTSGSSIFFVDDTGYMAASTINDSVSLNETRYTPAQNPNPFISSISQYIESNIAPFSQPSKFPNQTSQQVNVAGATYILATKTIYLPVSNQQYQLVLAVPRSDFYGSTDNAFKLSIITGCVIGAVGLILVAGLAYVASLPLKRLSEAMARLTKFDFSVLENGNLDHRSTIAELQEVERTFLMMVMAFAAGIRRNKELLMGRGPSQTPSGLASSNRT